MHSKKHEEKLTMLQEECAEVISAISKSKRFGHESRHPDGGPNNIEHLCSEIVDLLSVLYALSEENEKVATYFIYALNSDADLLEERWKKKLKYTKHQND